MASGINHSANPLYPIFLKPDRLRFLIVGGGEVGSEKLRNLLKSSPAARVKLVAPEISDEIKTLAAGNPDIELIYAQFKPFHLEGIHIAIIATQFPALNHSIHKIAKQAGLVVNVADTPHLCDFYMGSIVTKGDLKIGISTNGKSPTFAKRFRQVLEESLPESIPQLLEKLHVFRNRLKGDFTHKVDQLNALTSELVEPSGD